MQALRCFSSARLWKSLPLRFSDSRISNTLLKRCHPESLSLGTSSARVVYGENALRSAVTGYRTSNSRPWQLKGVCQMAASNGRVTHTADSAIDKVREAGLLKSQCLIGDQWVDADSGETVEVRNPATGEVVLNVAAVGAAETERAVEVAYSTFQTWSKLTGQQRGKHLRAWCNMMLAHREELGLLMTIEQGKPLKESLAEVDYGAGYVEFYSEEATRAYGDILPSPAPDKRILVIRQPVGVVGIVTPWNFPIAMITRKVAPALAAGCTVVVKPAELTPLCALAIAELAIRAGVPPGVVNVVVGHPKPIGEAILSSHRVAKLSFTGSTAVGKQLMAQAAATVKKVSLELGGNAPVLVFDDADIGRAAKGALAAKFRNTGQTCVCANRILVQDGVYDKFAEAFEAEVRGLKLGNGLHDGVTLGPLVNEASMKKAQMHVDDAVSKGARLVLGGKGSSHGDLFFEATILLDATPDMLIAREEVFGPVAPLFRFTTEEEAIRLANDTEFGLASYVYTENIARAWRVSEALEYGMVGLNETAISTEFAPFGGVKQSGHGREGSKYGLMDYMEMKYICLGGIV